MCVALIQPPWETDTIIMICDFQKYYIYCFDKCNLHAKLPLGKQVKEWQRSCGASGTILRNRNKE